MLFNGHRPSVLIKLMLILAVISSCREQIETDRKVKHIVLLGLNAFGSRGFQKATTPNMNKIVAKGAISPFARCLLPTSSSPNWTAMLTGVGPLQHGVYDNDWERDKQMWPPVIATEEGVFPSLFNWIGDQILSAKIHFFMNGEDCPGYLT
jgi:arylsulfatase A-like enzyme